MKIILINKDTNQREVWTMQDMLEHLNDFRNPEWIPYTKEDWREGWFHFGDTENYILVSHTK